MITKTGQILSIFVHTNQAIQAKAMVVWMTGLLLREGSPIYLYKSHGLKSPNI